MRFQSFALGVLLLPAPLMVRAMAVAAQIGGLALAIYAKDDAVACWYARFGAMPLLDGTSLKFILPSQTIINALEAMKAEATSLQ